MSLQLLRLAGLVVAPLALTLLAPAAAAAQGTGTVRGRVIEAGGQRPVSDAQLSILGTTLGAITNAAGDYVIANVPAGGRQVRVRRIGFQAVDRPVTVTAGGTARVDFTMTAAAAQLDQVVVTGTAGATSRRVIGNSITTVNAAEVTEKTSVSNVSEILQSRTPGVTILPGSGTPGTAGEIRIRGAGSLSGYRPVVYIDGVRMNVEALGNFNPTGSGTAGLAQSTQITSAFDFLNPRDIESIEVIKGPAAATLYGADASTGVIQIITKKGARGQQRLRWQGRAERGTSEWRLPTPVNYTTCDSTKVVARTTVNGVSVPSWPGCQGVALGTVLTQEPMRLDPDALRTGSLQRFGLTARGGGDRFTYFLSGDKSDEYGVYWNSFTHNKGGRANFGLTPNERTDLQVNLGYSQLDLRLPIQDESPVSILLNAARSRPGFRPVSAGTRSVVNGDTLHWPNFNPERSNSYNNRTSSERLTASTTLSYNPLSWLRNRLTLGLDQTFSTASLLFLPGDDTEPLGAVLQRTPRFHNYTVDYVANLPYKVTDALETTTSVGTQVVSRREEFLTAQGSGLGAPDVVTIGSASTTSGSNTFTENNSVGYYVQEQLGWRNRLFLTGAVRADDNSSFGTNFDVIVFPKASLSWVISEEPALERLFDAAHTNSFKLRTAWGQAGRAPSPYSATQTYTITRVTTATGTSSALVTNAFGNPDLKPERGEELEVGFESSHFGDRLGLDFTWYDKTTKDMLVSVSNAPSSGFTAARLGNLGEVSNRGVELALTAAPVQRRQFGWDTRVNFSTNRNRLVGFGIPGKTVDTPSGQAYAVVQQHRPGYPLGGYWSPFPLRCGVDPLAATAARTGANACAYNQGEPQLTAAGAVILDTAVYIGTPSPTREVGLSNTLTFFRNFRLYALLDYKGGHYLFNQKERNRCQAANDNCARNNDPRVRFPRTQADSLLARELIVYRNVPALFIEKADFVKLREVSLSITVPQRFVSRVGATGADLVLSGRNLALWSDYSGIDPEVNTYGGRLFVRADAYANPMTRRLAASLNLTF